MPKLAIDFGTSNTLIAEWNEAAQSPRTLRLPALGAAPVDGVPAVIPSLLYLEDAQAGRCLVGMEVRDRGLDVATDGRYFAGFKRAIAADIQGFSPTLDGCEVAPREAGAHFLRRVLVELKQAGYGLDELIFTVPVQSFERYLRWLSALAGEIGAQHVRLIDESTAAALGYQIHVPQALVLVCDFGGGTLDLSLVRSPGLKGAGVTLGEAAPGPDRIARVLAKAGQVLGGEDIDHWLVDDFLKRHGLARHELEADLPALKSLAERVKITLSSASQAEMAYFSDTRLKTFQTVYTRSDLEDLLESHDFYHKLQGALDTVLRQAEARGVRRDEIAHVLLVGGTTLIPSVQRAIRQNFDADRVHSHAPFEAVAHGALAALKGLQVDDFLYHGYGIRYWDARLQRHAYEPIFSPGSPYPSAQPVEIVLRASRPAQPAIELVIGEFEPGGTSPAEVVFDGKRLVSTPFDPSQSRVVALNAGEDARRIAPLDPPGFPGVDRVRVAFRVDAERHLRVRVHDLHTDRCLLDDVAVAMLR